MQIWTEDSGSGFIFWSWINRVIFNNKFKVVKGHGNRTVLNKIKNDRSNELIIAIVDRMLDNSYTERTYNSIQNVLRTHQNIFVPTYGSTERSFLTYKNLDTFINNINMNENKLREIILYNSKICGVIEISNIRESLFWKFYTDNVKADKTGDKFSEHIYNSLLATYTNNTYAKINKDKIGPCWLFDCCTVDKKTCKMKEEPTKLQKIKDIVNKSEFGYTIGEIIDCISIYLDRTYIHNKYDDRWKDEILKNNVSNLDIAYYADWYMRLNGITKWRYENIYRRMNSK